LTSWWCFFWNSEPRVFLHQIFNIKRILILVTSSMIMLSPVCPNCCVCEIYGTSCQKSDPTMIYRWKACIYGAHWVHPRATHLAWIDNISHLFVNQRIKPFLPLGIVWSEALVIVKLLKRISSSNAPYIFMYSLQWLHIWNSWFNRLQLIEECVIFFINLVYNCLSLCKVETCRA
jgi:hypothetical protein